MKQFAKIVKIIVVFFAALIGISFLWYGINCFYAGAEEQRIPFVDYVLYLLGFGDLEVSDHYLQAAFSVLGLLVVTLLSSVFTVSLFELRSKVKIGKNIRIRSRQLAELELQATGKEVYNLTATLISKCGKDITTQEQFFPFVAKKECIKLEMELVPGTPLYKYLRAVYLKPASKPQLILTVVYTDIASGQEYSMAQKYQLYGKDGGFVFAAPEGAQTATEFGEEVRKHIVEQTFPVNLATVWPCEAEDIDISYGYREELSQWQQNQAFCARVHMTGRRAYDPGTFTMAVTGDLLGNDWTTYYDLGCALKFSYKVTGNIALTMELKYGENRSCVVTQKFAPKERFDEYVLPLRTLDRQKLEHVEELCFTVFFRDVDPKEPIGEFVIRDCVLEVEML